MPVEALLNTDVPACLKFLQWFKSFFDRNTTGRQYDALKARKGRSMGPPAPTGIDSLNQTNSLLVVLYHQCERRAGAWASCSADAGAGCCVYIGSQLTKQIGYFSSLHGIKICFFR